MSDISAEQHDGEFEGLKKALSDAEIREADLRAAIATMAKCWTGAAYSPPDYYMGHSETCGGKGNDRACSCASNQARSAFKRGREALEVVIRGQK